VDSKLCSTYLSQKPLAEGLHPFSISGFLLTEQASSTSVTIFLDLRYRRDNSRSLGNCLTPMASSKEYWAEAMRYRFVSEKRSLLRSHNWWRSGSWFCVQHLRGRHIRDSTFSFTGGTVMCRTDNCLREMSVTCTARPFYLGQETRESHFASFRKVSSLSSVTLDLLRPMERTSQCRRKVLPPRPKRSPRGWDHRNWNSEVPSSHGS